MQTHWLVLIILALHEHVGDHLSYWKAFEAGTGQEKNWNPVAQVASTFQLSVAPNKILLAQQACSVHALSTTYCTSFTFRAAAADTVWTQVVYLHHYLLIFLTVLTSLLLLIGLDAPPSSWVIIPHDRGSTLLVAIDHLLYLTDKSQCNKQVCAQPSQSQESLTEFEIQNISICSHSRAPTCRRRASRAPYLRKFGNPLIWKILVVMWLSIRPYIHTPRP